MTNYNSIDHIGCLQEMIELEEQKILGNQQVIERITILQSLIQQQERSILAKANNSDFLFLLIIFKFKVENKMETIKILTVDAYANSVIIPAIKKINEINNNFLFEIQEATIDHMPTDVDFKFLHFKDPTSEISSNYIDDILDKTPLNLYASPEYLNKCGEPKEISELDNHTIIRPQRGDVLTKIGKVDYLPIDYKEESINVDTLSSLFSMGEAGFGIICVADKNVEKQKLKLEKISQLGNTCEIPLVFSAHKKIKDNKICDQLKNAIREILE